MRKLIIIILLIFKPVMIYGQTEICYRNEEISEYLEESSFSMPNVNYDDYIIETSEWKNEIDFSKEYESRTKYYYQIIDKIRYVHITNTKSPDQKFMLNEVIIGDKGSVLNYTVSCNNCPNNLHNQIKDGLFHNQGFYIIGEAELVIDLGNYYELEDIDVNLFVSNYAHGENAYYIYTSKDKINLFTKTLMRIWFSTPQNEYRWFQHNMLNDVLIYNPLYLPKVETTSLLESTKKMKTFAETEYREFTYFYKNYDYLLIEVPKEESDFCEMIEEVEPDDQNVDEQHYSENIEEANLDNQSDEGKNNNEGEVISLKQIILKSNDKITSQNSKADSLLEIPAEQKLEIKDNNDLKQKKELIKEEKENSVEKNKPLNKIFIIPNLILIFLLLVIIGIRRYVKY